MKSASAWTSRVLYDTQGRTEKRNWTSHTVVPAIYKGVAGCSTSYTSIAYFVPKCLRHPKTPTVCR